MLDRQARLAAFDWLTEQGAGEGAITYKLRDWLFSRQRYWGEPFPVIHRSDGSTNLVAESDLPVELPETEAKDRRVEQQQHREREDDALADDRWSLTSVAGTNFFRGLALIDLAEAMLKRAFGDSAVAVDPRPHSNRGGESHWARTSSGGCCC